jgi:uncharacterized membrane protein (UPF0127 family)
MVSAVAEDKGSCAPACFLHNWVMMMTRRIFFIASLLALAWLAVPDGEVAAQVQFETGKAVVVSAQARHSFAIEIARTAAERSQGLMHRPSLAPDRGMLFDFGRIAPISMWMKNTLIPLDMLFIAADGRIVNIAENTTPGSLDAISSAGSALAVLELAGGNAKRLGIRPGDMVVNALFGNNF